MARKKATEYIATELNLDMLDNVVQQMNETADIIRGSADIELVGKALARLCSRFQNGFESVPNHRGELTFTMHCKALPLLEGQNRIYEYWFKFNTYTNEVTCIDEDKHEFTMPMLTDALAVIRDKAIEIAFS
jgi:hypothetical protein